MREKLRGYLQQRLEVEFDEANALLGEQQSNSVVSASTTYESTIKITKSPQEIKSDIQNGILATSGPWMALIDEKRGMIYYHDPVSSTTTWNRPNDFPFIKLSASKRRELQEVNRRYLEWRKESVTSTRSKVNVLGKGVVTASSTSSEIYDELNSLNEIQKDIEDRLLTSDQEKKAIYKSGEWSAYLDDASGLVYYYNEVEKRSVWDAPDKRFLEGVKDRMMEDPQSFVDLTKGDDVRVSGLELREGDDVTREVKRDEVTGATESIVDQVEMEKSYFMQETEDGTTPDRSIDYDAAARLSYEAAGSIGDFDAFKTTYIADTCEMVAAKHKTRIEEAARVADESLKVARHKQLEEEAKLARWPVDYDAAARLSYELSGLREQFNVFKSNYLVDTSAMVAEKFQARLEAAKVADESTLSAATGAEQLNGVKSQPFFLDVEADVQSPDPDVPSEELVLKSESLSSAQVKNDARVESSTEEVFEAQPKLPEDDPFASGSDVASLISPLKTETLYDILRVDMSATRSEIKRSYVTLAKETHPDALLQNGIVNDKEAEKKFTEIAAAYKILSDPTERRRYNRELKAKGLSRSAGNLFENWVMSAAKAMDEALTKAERDLETSQEKMSPW